MPEPFDLYSDAFTVTITPWGANMSFQLRPAHPVPLSDGASADPLTQLGTIRMSNEHLKAMVFIIKRHLSQLEHESGVQHNVPADLLEQLGIPTDEWDEFWSHARG